ncbi:MAG: DUF4834 family protein [Marinilabiliales bacterium]|nr:DUF4834 family protein [Marinilabiliales bacterium]
MLFILLNIGTLIDTIFILLLVYYGLRIFFRYFGPRVVESAADKIYRDMKAQEEARRPRSSGTSGQVTVERQDQRNKVYRKTDGEYVDFEEVK